MHKQLHSDQPGLLCHTKHIQLLQKVNSCCCFSIKNPLAAPAFLTWVLNSKTYDKYSLFLHQEQATSHFKDFSASLHRALQESCDMATNSCAWNCTTVQLCCPPAEFIALKSHLLSCHTATFFFCNNPMTAHKLKFKFSLKLCYWHLHAQISAPNVSITIRNKNLLQVSRRISLIVTEPSAPSRIQK